MVTSGKYVGRIVTLIAGAVALCVAVLLPGVYFLQGQRLLHHDLATKAEVKSEIVGQIVSRSPQLWRYQTVRLIEMLTRAPGEIGSDFAQVLDESGKEILSVGTWPGTPVAVASHEVLDSGFVAGEVRVARSMRGLLHGTAAVGALGLALALLVFGVLRVLPIRALNRAMAALATQLRHREKIAGFSRGMLAQQPPSEMIANAVQVVLEGFQADAVAYVERGASEGEVIVHAVEGLARRPASNIGRCAEGSPLAAALASGEDFDGPLSAAAPALPFEWARGMSAMALAVVPGEAGVRGVLCAFSAAPRSFTAEESAFLDAAASVLSGALLRHGKDDRLAYLAQFDPLTGLPNRALLHDRFSQMIELARRRGSCIAALFVDLDEFKQVNDTLGHAAGDDLLKQVAGRLRSAVRAGDTVARISGDEFAVVLPDLARPDEAGLVAQKLVDVMTTPFLIREQETYVTASVGVATFPNDGAHAEELLAAADAAMYRAKQLGRSNYQFFTAELNEKSRARAQLSAELRRALEQEEFKLAYQPKVKLDSGGLLGAEALLRWQHPARGMVSPAEFIPPLEESGLIVAVGEWVLRRVCADLKAWASAGLEVLPIAVNLSARQFRQLDLDVRIKSLISSAGIDPGLIELEITESQIMHDPDQAIRMMRSLRDAGLRIAIDDFGTGYSSLSYLTQFPVASLKIDRTFVSKVVASTSDQAIVTTIIDMAYTLGFSIVAEGVETADQAALLQRLGCEQAQGYYFARPMPAEEFVRSLARAAVAAN